MGHRLTRITTRTGDDGTTGLATGLRLPKDSARIMAMGDVDELNSCIGLLLSHPITESVRIHLEDIQHDLFDIGGELAMPGEAILPVERIEALEALSEDLNSRLPPLKEFILPGGGAAAATCHLARTVCRRAERQLVHLANDEPVTDTARHYMNRLSDILFVLAREIARETGSGEVFWRSRRIREVQGTE